MSKFAKTLKNARIEYKISLASSLLAFIFGIFTFVFVLLPIYGVLDDPNGPEVLDKSENLMDVLSPLILGLIILSIITGAVGFYRESKSKSKKKS